MVRGAQALRRSGLGLPSLRLVFGLPSPLAVLAPHLGALAPRGRSMTSRGLGASGARTRAVTGDCAGCAACSDWVELAHDAFADRREGRHAGAVVALGLPAAPFTRACGGALRERRGRLVVVVLEMTSGTLSSDRWRRAPRSSSKVAVRRSDRAAHRPRTRRRRRDRAAVARRLRPPGTSRSPDARAPRRPRRADRQSPRADARVEGGRHRLRLRWSGRSLPGWSAGLIPCRLLDAPNSDARVHPARSLASPLLLPLRIRRAWVATHGRHVAVKMRRSRSCR